MLKKFKELLFDNNIDGYIVPKNDEFFSEYAFPNRLLKISKFSGSAGFAIVMRNANYLFVDGRYTVQAKLESGSNFKIIEIPKYFPYDLFKHKKLKNKIGFDPKLFTQKMLQNYFKNTCNLIPINNNLVDHFSLIKENKKIKQFYNIESKYTGEKVNSKINRLCSVLKKKKIR